VIVYRGGLGFLVGFGVLEGGIGTEGGLGLMVGFGIGTETLASLAWGNNFNGSPLVIKKTPPKIPASRIKITINWIAPASRGEPF